MSKVIFLLFFSIFIFLPQSHGQNDSDPGISSFSEDNVPDSLQGQGEAVRWYRMAAERGEADAQFNLGLSYAIGLGVP